MATIKMLRYREENNLCSQRDSKDTDGKTRRENQTIKQVITAIIKE
jgi:hypothetical protein